MTPNPQASFVCLTLMTVVLAAVRMQEELVSLHAEEGPAVVISGTPDHCAAEPPQVAKLDFATIDRRFPLVDGMMHIEAEQLAVPYDQQHRLFEYENIPAELKALVGQRVRMHGNMYPTAKDTGITQFFFSGETRGRAYLSYASSTPPYLFLEIFLADGLQTDYYQSPLIVEGEFSISREILDGRDSCWFVIENATVRRTQPRADFRPIVVHFGC